VFEAGAGGDRASTRAMDSKARRRKPPGLLHALSEVARLVSSPRCSKLAAAMG